MFKRLSALRPGQGRSGKPSREARRPRMSVEALESRQLLTVDFIAAQGIGGLSLTATATVADAAGDTYATGLFAGTVNFNPAPAGTPYTLTAAGSQDAYLAKYDPAGKLLWAQDLPGSPGTPAKGNALALTPAGAVALAGQFQGTLTVGGLPLAAPAGATDAFVAEFDPAAGRALWAKAFDNGTQEVVSALAVDAQGNLDAAGNFLGRGSFGTTKAGAAVALANAGGTDGFALQLDPAGNTVWAAGLGGAGGDQANRVAVDAGGAVLVGGSYSGTASFGAAALTSAGALNGFVAKLSPAGVVQWADGIQGATGVELVGALAVDAQGDAVVGGTFYGTAAVAGLSLTAPTATVPQAYLAKISPAGAGTWAVQLDGTAGAAVSDVHPDAAGNLYAGGYFQGTGSFNPAGSAAVVAAGGYDGFVVSLDGAGAYRWSAKAGGPGTDTVTALAVTGTDAVDVVGAYASPAIFGLNTIGGIGNSNVYLARIGTLAPPPAGVIGFNGPTFGVGGSAIAVQATAVDAAGNTYITGAFSGTSGTYGHPANFNPLGTPTAFVTPTGAKDAFLAKYSPSGLLTWFRDFAEPAGKSAAGNALAIDPSGYVVVGGQFAGAGVAFNAGGGQGGTLTAPGTATDAFLAKFDTAGTFQWAEGYDSGNTAGINAVAVDPSGKIDVTGSYYGGATAIGLGGGKASIALPTNGSTDTFLAQLDGSGNPLWATRASGSGADVGKKLAVDGSGNVYIVGTFTNAASFPSAGAGSGPSVTSQGSLDLFLAKYSNAGAVAFVNDIGSVGLDQAGGVAVDKQGSIYIAGAFGSTLTFSGLSVTAPLNQTAGFVLKVSSADAGVWLQGVAATQAVQLNALGLDSANNVYYSGLFSGQIALNPAAPTTLTFSNGSTDALVGSLDSSGKTRWALTAGGSGNDASTGLAVMGTDQVVTVGQYVPTATFNRYQQPLGTMGLSNAFVANISLYAPPLGQSKTRFTTA